MTRESREANKSLERQESRETRAKRLLAAYSYSSLKMCESHMFATRVSSTFTLLLARDTRAKRLLSRNESLSQEIRELSI